MDSRFVLRASPRTWISLWVVIFSLWLTIRYFTLILDIGRLVFAAFLLSLAIRPLAELLCRWHIPRGITVLLAYAGLIGMIALLGSLLIPVITTEVNNLRADAPSLIQQSLDRVGGNRILGKWLPSVDTVSTDLAQRLDTFVQTFITTATRVGGFALELFIVLVLSYFFVTEPNMGERLLIRWVPQAHHERARRVAHNLHYRLTRWVLAQLGIAVYFAVVFSAGLTVLGVPFALTIGVVGGALEIVPYLGGITAWLLAVFSAITVNPLLVVWITVFYVGVVELEAHIIAPALYGHVTGIHPAIVLIALITGARAGGIIGVLFAVPISVVLITLLSEIRAPAADLESTG